MQYWKIKLLTAALLTATLLTAVLLTAALLIVALLAAGLLTGRMDLSIFKLLFYTKYSTSLILFALYQQILISGKLSSLAQQYC